MTIQDTEYTVYPHYAVIDGNMISNIVVAESLDHAKLTTGKECFEITAENPAENGWEYDPILKKCIIPKTYLTIEGILYYLDKKLNQLIAVEE